MGDLSGVAATARARVELRWATAEALLGCEIAPIADSCLGCEIAPAATWETAAKHLLLMRALNPGAVALNTEQLSSIVTVLFELGARRAAVKQQEDAMH